MNTTIKKVNDYIYMIDQEMVRCFVIIGDNEALIIDTGNFHIDFVHYVKEITTKPVRLCLTHSDKDHTANIEQFDKVYLHQEEVPYLNVNKELELITIEEGYVFDLGNLSLEVIHTPGHTPGSISLLDRKNKILFSGDTVSYGPIYMFGKNRDIHLYLKTLKRLDTMAKEGIFEEIYPCHNICPISQISIHVLIQCVEGILNQTIQPTQAALPFDMPQVPELYMYPPCGILYIDQEDD